MLSFEEFKKAKRELDSNLNEGILGDALKSLKDKFALSVSKRIGGAKKIDNLINQRKVALHDFLDQKIKLEEELLLAKKAYDESQGDENLKTQYDQKKRAFTGQMAAIDKLGYASKNKFDINLTQLKKKGGELVSDYADLRVAEMGTELATIEIEAYKKMGKNTSKLEAKLKEQAATIDAKKEEIKTALQKKKEENKETVKVIKGAIYDYTNSKGALLQVKVLDNIVDKEGFVKVVNKEKEGESEGFRVNPKELKATAETKAPSEEEQKAAA